MMAYASTGQVVHQFAVEALSLSGVAAVVGALLLLLAGGRIAQAFDQPVQAPAPAAIKVALATWYDGPTCIASPPCRWLGPPGPTGSRIRRRPAQGLPEGNGVNPGG